jgi:hypothetical protein
MPSDPSIFGARQSEGSESRSKSTRWPFGQRKTPGDRVENVVSLGSALLGKSSDGVNTNFEAIGIEIARGHFNRS